MYVQVINFGLDGFLYKFNMFCMQMVLSTAGCGWLPHTWMKDRKKAIDSENKTLNSIYTANVPHILPGHGVEKAI